MNQPEPAPAQTDDEKADPDVIQRVAEALEGTDSGQAPQISLDSTAAASAPSLPQRGG